MHDMARIRIRRLCSVVPLFITGKENICFFYERQKHRLSLCYFLVGVSGFVRKHSSAGRVFYISLVFSNARRVLSQCNTRLRLLYL